MGVLSALGRGCWPGHAPYVLSASSLCLTISVALHIGDPGSLLARLHMHDVGSRGTGEQYARGH